MQRGITVLIADSALSQQIRQGNGRPGIFIDRTHHSRKRLECWGIVQIVDRERQRFRIMIGRLHSGCDGDRNRQGGSLFIIHHGIGSEVQPIALYLEQAAIHPTANAVLNAAAVATIRRQSGQFDRPLRGIDVLINACCRRGDRGIGGISGLARYKVGNGLIRRHQLVTTFLEHPPQIWIDGKKLLGNVKINRLTHCRLANIVTDGNAVARITISVQTLQKS